MTSDRERAGGAALLAALLGACSSSVASVPGSVDPSLEERPNVLLIVADDLGVDMVGAYREGGDLPPTPNLDALAAEGVLFRNAYSNPNCSPTRATILTGRYAHRTGIGHIVSVLTDRPEDERTLQPSEWTLPEVLDAGTGSSYAHAAIGKWHLNTLLGAGEGLDAPRTIGGFSHYSGAFASLSPGESYHRWSKVVDGVESHSDAYLTTDQVDDAIDWIAGASGAPWFLYLALSAPHSPFHRPPDSLHTQDLDVPPDNRRFYKAMVEAMDTELGRLFASIDRETLANTMVFFLGDNGTPVNVTAPPFSPKHAKGTGFEGGINVPFIVKGPLVSRPGRESAALVHTVDTFATVAEIAGVDPAAVTGGTPIDSVSLLPCLAAPGPLAVRRYVYAERFEHPELYRSKAIRDERFKLLVLGPEEREGFYDLESDPFERSNLACRLPAGSEEEAAYVGLWRELDRILGRGGTGGLSGPTR